jgi:DNA-binding NarL/FixJ family response regulator
MRILLADDHDVVRRGLREILEEQPGWEVCGEAVDGRQAVDMALALAPQVVVLDLAMPLLNGLEATRLIKKALRRTEVLILSMHDSEQMMRDVLNAGALGYLLKTDSGRRIRAAVEALALHKPFLTGRMTEEGLDLAVAVPRDGSVIDPLTAREREIVRLLSNGKSNRTISCHLGISVKTVETHRTNIMRKLGINSVTQVVRYAMRNNLAQA